MKRVLLSLIVVSTLFSMTNCKKSNLTRDQWEIEKATDLEDSSDITEDYDGELWEFAKDGEYLENNESKGTWAWGDGKEKLIITENDGTIDTYNVLKLKRNEMWLEIPTEEEIHLSRIK